MYKTVEEAEDEEKEVMNKISKKQRSQAWKTGFPAFYGLIFFVSFILQHGSIPARLFNSGFIMLLVNVLAIAFSYFDQGLFVRQNTFFWTNESNHLMQYLQSLKQPRVFGFYSGVFIGGLLMIIAFILI